MGRAARARHRTCRIEKVRALKARDIPLKERSVDEDLSEKFVIHYKGENRKLWMMEQWGHLLPKRR